MSFINKSIDLYNFVNYEAEDSRVRGWFLMDTFLYPLALILIYLFLVLKLIPYFMHNRPPFKLKKIIIAYNIIQVIACYLLFKEFFINGWSEGLYSLKCYSVDYSDNPRAYRFVVLTWWGLMLKISDLFDTIFFALRKKNNQISFLHLYHHATTVLMTWAATKYVAGIMISLPAMINSVIHIIMYSYYLLAMLKYKWVTKLKIYITIIQMGQFVFLLLYSLQLLFPSCDHLESSKYFIYIYDPYIAINFYLFYHFYKKAYIKKVNKKEIKKHGHKVK